MKTQTNTEGHRQTQRNTDIPSESEDNNPKEGVLALNKNATARKWLSRYQENLFIEAPEKQEEAIKWRSKYQKPGKVEQGKTLQTQLSELRPKIQNVIHIYLFNHQV